MEIHIFFHLTVSTDRSISQSVKEVRINHMSDHVIKVINTVYRRGFPEENTDSFPRIELISNLNFVFDDLVINKNGRIPPNELTSLPIRMTLLAVRFRIDHIYFH